MCFTNSFVGSCLVWSNTRGCFDFFLLLFISIVLCWSSTYFKYTSIATVLTDKKRHIYVYAVSVFVYLVFRVLK
jgi:hypothetical protein